MNAITNLRERLKQAINHANATVPSGNMATVTLMAILIEAVLLLTEELQRVNSLPKPTRQAFDLIRGGSNKPN